MAGIKDKLKSVFLENKLEMLEIVAYANDKQPLSSIGSVTASYNPETLQFSSTVSYENVHPLDQSKSFPSFQSVEHGSLSVQLRFDGLDGRKKNTVSQQVIHLNQLCAGVDGPSGETNYLEVKWGKLPWQEMKIGLWRMTSITTTYQLFDRDGTPLRAAVDLVLTPCPPKEKNSAAGKGAQAFSSMVNDKDRLPQIAGKDGSQSDYLDLAKNNPQLNNLNDLQPGSAIKSMRGLL